MTMKYCLLVIGLLAVICQQRSEDKCEQEGQDKCLFVVSTGRSGSTALMNTLNSIPNVFVRGENGGVFYLVENLHNYILSISNSRFKSEDDLEFYRDFATTHKTAQFNFFRNSTAKCIARYIFKEMYGYLQYGAYRVGFKEIRFGPLQSLPVKYNLNPGVLRASGLRILQKIRDEGKLCNTYQDFKDRISFLMSLCDDPLVILNMRRNVTSLRQSGFYVGRSDKKISTIVEYMKWLVKFEKQFPQKALVIYYEDMFDNNLNQTIINNLMDFLNVERNPNASFTAMWRQQKQ